MYDYPYYKEHDKEKILSFMRDYPFVMLIAAGKNGRIEATQLPVLVEEKDGKLIIRGHIARKTDHHLALVDNPSAMLIFTGAHTYVSASWYTGNPSQGSTWNYISIHARGKIKWMSEEELVSFMKKLTLHFEKGNTASSTVYDNLPEEYTSKMIKGIDGFEMEVEEMDNVHKLSQNRDEKSYDNIVVKLKEQGADGAIIAELMEKNREKVFGEMKDDR
jgi:transcriptional regulator